MFSFIGTWVQDVGESWVMLSMSPDPRLIAMLATCFLGPMLIFTLPAGLLADRHDRRKILLWSQAACALTAAAPAVAIHFHVMSPAVLLVCTAFLGAAVALGAPAWQTLVPELLPRSKTAEAITFGSIAFNLARVVGPALGGFLLAVSNPEITFIVNGVSFGAVWWVLFRYPEIRRASELARPRTPMHWVGAFADPFRDAWRANVLRATFVIGSAFAATASVMMAILPAFAKHSLGASASGYGALLSALGLGAITCGLLLSRIRARFGKRAIVTTGICAYGAATLLASHASHVWGAVPFFFIAGLGWVACLTSLSATVQMNAPAETKSRVTALYYLCFYAFATVGATVGGLIAAHWSERTAIATGALASLCVSLLAAASVPRAQRFVTPIGPSTK